MRAILIVACAALAARAYAEPSSCPTDERVRAELARLLPQLPPEAGEPRIEVADLGDRFRLTLNGANRLFADAARDCGARARTAGVALAVALSPPTVSFPPLSQPTPPRVASVPPFPERRRLFFGVDVGPTYGYFAGTNYGGGTIQFHVGAEYPRWTIEGLAFFQASAARLSNNTFAAATYPYLAGGIGPAVALKLGARWRIGFSSTIGLAGGDAGTPGMFELDVPPHIPVAYSVGGGIVTLTPNVSVDLARRGRQAIYAELALYYRVWFDIGAPPAFQTYYSDDSLPANRNEVGVRLSFGFHYTR
jgi:hypothetical protein